MSAESVAGELVAVVGGGTMGAGIAQAFTATGCRVVLLERDALASDAARGRVVAGLTRTGDQAAASRLTTTTDYADLADSVLVVEAVFEDLPLKRTVLAELERVCRDDALLATNTSALPVTELAESMRQPARFLGMHFFNPVPRSDLVEIVVPAATDPETVDTARRWVDRLGKTAIVVRDSPGFASSRLGVAIALEAMRMVEEGVASPEDIDAAMVLGYKFPMGPLRLTDLVGLDVRLAIADNLAGRLGDRFAAPQLLRDLVAEGRLGRKTGRGFYTWPAPLERR